MSSYPAITNFFRREWLTRRTWLAALAVLNVLPLVYEPEVRAAWATFGFACILPLLAVGLAATQDTDADRYWASLGGRPLHRALVRLAGHLGLLAICGLLLFRHLRWSAWDPAELPIILPATAAFAGLVSALLYVSASLARRSLSATAALAGPLAVGGLLALGVGIDHRLGNWSVIEGAGVRMAVLLAAGLGALLQREGRLPGRTEAPRLLLGAAGLAGLVSLLNAGWTGRPILLAPVLQGWSADGSTALYLPQSAGILGSRRALLWRAGEGLRPVGPVGAHSAALMSDGRAAVFVPGPGGGVWVGDEQGMVPCPLPADNGVVQSWNEADGALLVVLTGPSGAVGRFPDGSCGSASGPEGALGSFRWASTVHGLVVTPPAVPDPPDFGLVTAGRLEEAHGRGSWPVGRDLDGQGAGIVRTEAGARAFFTEGPVVDLEPGGERARHVLSLWAELTE